MKRMRRHELLGMGVLVVAMVSMMSCIAAIPLAIKYYKDQNQVKAVAETTIPAEKVYSTAVSMAEEKGVQILKKEDDKFYLEVTDGVQTATLKVKTTDKGTTEITIIASIQTEEAKEQKKTQEQELAHRLMSRLCERLNANCTVEEKEKKE